MGPKSENVGFSLVLPLLFEGSRGPGVPQPCQKLAEKTPKKWDFSSKMLHVDIQNCASCLGGNRIFRKFAKQKLLDSEKWSRKTLDGKCDGYMRGLDGAEKRKCWFFIGFTNTF